MSCVFLRSVLVSLRGCGCACALGMAIGGGRSNEVGSVGLAFGLPGHDMTGLSSGVFIRRYNNNGRGTARRPSRPEGLEME